MPEGKALADPPLLRLEGEACHAYLSMLLHLNTAASEPLQQAADVESRLLQLCIANLQCFRVQHYLLTSNLSRMHVFFKAHNVTDVFLMAANLQHHMKVVCAAARPFTPSCMLSARSH